MDPGHCHGRDHGDNASADLRRAGIGSVESKGFFDRVSGCDDLDQARCGGVVSAGGGVDGGAVRDFCHLNCDSTYAIIDL